MITRFLRNLCAPTLGGWARTVLLNTADEATVVFDGSAWHIDTKTERKPELGETRHFVTHIQSASLIRGVHFTYRLLNDALLWGSDAAMAKIAHDWASRGADVTWVDETEHHD